MDKPLITKILEDLEKDLAGTINHLQPVAIQLLLWFFMYDLTTALLLAKPGSNPLVILKEKIKVWAFLYAIIYFFKDIMDLIKQMFEYFARVATQQPPLELVDLPYKILQLAYMSLETLLDRTNLMSPSTWILMVGFVVGLYIFARICLTVGMVILEYLFMSSLVIILVPFMMFEKLRFVGDKVVGTLINLNMKIFVIRYLMIKLVEFLKEPIKAVEGDSVILNSFYWLAAMGMMAMMTMKGNEMAQTLISGVTSFGDSSELVRNAREGLQKTLSTASGAYKGTAKGAYDGMLAGANKGGGIGAAVGTILGGAKGAIKGGYGGFTGKGNSNNNNNKNNE